MLIRMATAKSVTEFVILHTTASEGGRIPIPEFRERCQQWAFEHGLNPPSGRLISRVLREQWGVEPQGARYDWFYAGIIWKA